MTNETPLQTAVRLLKMVENDVAFMRKPDGYLLTFAQMDEIVRFNRAALDAGAPDDVRELIEALDDAARWRHNLAAHGAFDPVGNRGYEQCESESCREAYALIAKYRPQAPASEDPFEGVNYG